MIIRVRTDNGTHRISINDDSKKQASYIDLKNALCGICSNNNIDTYLFWDINCQRPIITASAVVDDNAPLSSLGVTHGSLLFIKRQPLDDVKQIDQIGHLNIPPIPDKQLVSAKDNTTVKSTIAETCTYSDTDCVRAPDQIQRMALIDDDELQISDLELAQMLQKREHVYDRDGALIEIDKELQAELLRGYLDKKKKSQNRASKARRKSRNMIECPSFIDDEADRCENYNSSSSSRYDGIEDESTEDIMTKLDALIDRNSKIRYKGRTVTTKYISSKDCDYQQHKDDYSNNSITSSGIFKRFIDTIPTTTTSTSSSSSSSSSSGGGGGGGGSGSIGFIADEDKELLQRLQQEDNDAVAAMLLQEQWDHEEAVSMSNDTTTNTAIFSSIANSRSSNADSCRSYDDVLQSLLMRSNKTSASAVNADATISPSYTDVRINTYDNAEEDELDKAIAMSLVCSSRINKDVYSNCVDDDDDDDDDDMLAKAIKESIHLK